jgi:hypothetical protein
MGTCQYCAKETNTVSDAIGYCADCIRTHFEEIRPEIKRVHRHSRKAYGLPEEPPASSEGMPFAVKRSLSEKVSGEYTSAMSIFYVKTIEKAGK